MIYPKFDRSQYNCIASPKAVAEFLAKALVLEQRHKELEAARTKLKAAKTSCPTELRSGLLDSMTRTVNVKEPSYSLEDALDRAAALYKRTLDPHLLATDRHRLRSQACLLLLEHYGSFAVEQFEKDFLKRFPEESDAKTDYRSAHRAVRRKEREIEEHWAAAPSLFKTVPRSFGEFRQSEKCDARMMSEIILRKFYADWRRRAPAFSVPVNIYGYAIYSLPPQGKVEWLEAYDTLGLGRIKKRLCYQPLRHEFSQQGRKSKQIEGVLAGNSVEPEEVILND